MTRLRWSEYLFVGFFLLFAVGGGLLWPSRNIVDALLALVAGTVLAVLVWLGIVYLVVRRRDEAAAESTERDESSPRE
ncbi:MAG: hypothetical protein V3T05_00155 [Myxococcota bacterium]